MSLRDLCSRKLVSPFQTMWCATETNRGLAIRVFFFFFPNKAKLNNANSKRSRNISAQLVKIGIKTHIVSRVSHFMRKVKPESEVHLCVSLQIKNLLGGDLFVDTQGTGVGMVEVRLTIYSVP